MSRGRATLPPRERRLSDRGGGGIDVSSDPFLWPSRWLSPCDGCVDCGRLKVLVESSSRLGLRGWGGELLGPSLGASIDCVRLPLFI